MIVTELQGGMGNQMFQYAVGRHLSVIHNAPLYLDTCFLNARSPKKNFTFRSYDISIFNIDASIAPLKIAKAYGFQKSIFIKIISRFTNPGPIKFVGEKKFCYNENVLLLPDNVYLSGYWQTEKYFQYIRHIIVKDFTLKAPLPGHIESLKNQIRKCNAVCLHVRRGDFVHNSMHGTLGNDYYSKAADIISSKISNPVYYVFSDDINWCKQNILLPDKNVHFVDDSYAGEKGSGHFCLMVSCKHFIIPNSSFAWWAAWLSANPDKIVVAPKVWFHSSTWDTSDILPPSWIAI